MTPNEVLRAEGVRFWRFARMTQAEIVNWIERHSGLLHPATRARLRRMRKLDVVQLACDLERNDPNRMAQATEAITENRQRRARELVRVLRRVGATTNPRTLERVDAEGREAVARLAGVPNPDKVSDDTWAMVVAAFDVERARRARTTSPRREHG